MCSTTLWYKWKAFENIFLLKHSTAKHEIFRRESQTQKSTYCQKKPVKPLWENTLLKSPWVFKVTISCLLTTTWKLASFLFACLFWHSPYWKLLQNLTVLWNNSSIHCSSCLFNGASHLTTELYVGLISVLARDVFKQVGTYWTFSKNGCHMIKPTGRLLKSTKEVALISFHSPWDSRCKTAKWRPLISIFADEYCSMQASAKTLLHKRISFLEVKTQSPTKPCRKSHFVWV